MRRSVCGRRCRQVYENLSPADKAKFEQAYSAAYTPAKDVLSEIYDEVRRCAAPRRRLPAAGPGAASGFLWSPRFSLAGGGGGTPLRTRGERWARRARGRSWEGRGVSGARGSGNEIRSVIMHGDRFERFPIGKIDGTLTWQVGEKVPAPPPPR